MSNGGCSLTAAQSMRIERPWSTIPHSSFAFAIMPNSAPPARNVFGEPLVPCSFDPLTGFFRDGCCRTNAEDLGTHVVCALMTEEFLEFSVSRGNDLATPVPEWGFPGLKPGDHWCLCALRWAEALEAGVAPPVILESTNYNVLDLIPFEVLRPFAYESTDD
jgi:uncharacterized protein (DUF2237 family)